MRIKPEQYAELLRWLLGLADWNTVLHMTYKWESSEDSARRVFDRWRRANVKAYPMLWALEPNPGRKGWHVHGIAAFSPRVCRKALWQDWFERKGRCLIEPIRVNGQNKGRDPIQAVQYCIKYVLKGNHYWQVDNCSPLPLFDTWQKRAASAEVATCQVSAPVRSAAKVPDGVDEKSVDDLVSSLEAGGVIPGSLEWELQYGGVTGSGVALPFPSLTPRAQS
jgi:hypothetical protein